MPTGRKTGGRKAGTPNRRTAERKQAAAELEDQFRAEIPGYWEGDAVALAQFTYRDPTVPWPVRMECMRLAARYERPQLNAIAFQSASAPDEVQSGPGLSGLLAAARAAPPPKPYMPRPPEPEIIGPRHPPVAPAPPGFAWMIDLSKLKEIEDDA